MQILAIETSAKAAGANYFLPKPLFQSTLFNALLRISGGENARILPHQAHVKYDFTGKRVLLAEDVALNMEVAVKLLTMTGVQVVCAKDGAQAVALYKEFEPGYFDCVLMDINMPVMDGYAATKVIRASGRPDARSLPIYAMTANAFSEDVAAALDAGMSGHIAKPIETEALYQSMKMAFDSKARSDTEGK